MTARTCPECGGLVASTINTCPHCGYHYSNFVNNNYTQNTSCQGSNPYTNITPSIIALILFWPLGVVSFIFYFLSFSCWYNGNEDGAKSYGTTSIRCARVGIWIAIAFFIIALLVVAALNI